MRFETAALLAELDSLAFPDRTRLLATWAQGLAGSRALGVLLDDLYGGDQFQRQIAVFLAAVAGERETIAGALEDPDWDVRRPAIGAWLRSGAPSSGRRYPDVVLDVAEAELAELAELSVPDQARWWGRSGEGVLAAGAAVPLRVLDLLERYAPPGYLPGPLSDYTALTAADHTRLLALMTAPSRAAWAPGR